MSKRMDWQKTDPVQYFHELYEGRSVSRKCLEREHRCLYRALKERGVLGRCIPNSRSECVRDWGTIDPLGYFKEQYGKREMTRTDLKTIDPGLHRVLRKKGLLDVVFAGGQKQRRWKKMDPVAYFIKHYSGKVTTREQLKSRDWGLHHELWRRGLLSRLIGRSGEPGNWGESGPLAYFKENCARLYSTREQLRKSAIHEHRKLYRALEYRNQLEEAIPEKEEHCNWNKLGPVAFFKGHYAGKITSARQLARENKPLYTALHRRGLLWKLLPERAIMDWRGKDPLLYFERYCAEKYETAQALRVSDVKAHRAVYYALKRRGMLARAFSRERADLEGMLNDIVGDEE